MMQNSWREEAADNSSVERSTDLAGTRTQHMSSLPSSRRFFLHRTLQSANTRLRHCWRPDALGRELGPASAPGSVAGNLVVTSRDSQGPSKPTTPSLPCPWCCIQTPTTRIMTIERHWLPRSGRRPPRLLRLVRSANAAPPSRKWTLNYLRFQQHSMTCILQPLVLVPATTRVCTAGASAQFRMLRAIGPVMCT